MAPLQSGKPMLESCMAGFLEGMEVVSFVLQRILKIVVLWLLAWRMAQCGSGSCDLKTPAQVQRSLDTINCEGTTKQSGASSSAPGMERYWPLHHLMVIFVFGTLQ
mmetsp:Transcript_25730/g.59486  ORF Transcript_25730/g.59486 Transcript_25730/m.59486 type:complete len:106 (-) Transcript_25730:1131-1448(-)